MTREGGPTVSFPYLTCPYVYVLCLISYLTK